MMQKYEVTANVNGRQIFKTTANEINLADQIAGAARVVEKAIKSNNKLQISIDAKPI